MKYSNVKTLENLLEVNRCVLHPIPYYIEDLRKKGADRFEVDVLEAIFLGTDADTKKAMERLKMRQKLTVITNEKV